LHLDTYESKQRVVEINKTVPECGCEKYRMSTHSHSPVGDSEVVARFVFSPMFVHKKTGKITPNIFGHVFTVGCSIQRENFVTVQEVLNLINDTISDDMKKSWKGTLLAESHELRKIMIGDSRNRAVCIYDTAEKNNPAHGEISQSQRHDLDEADIVELRQKLFTAFANGIQVQPDQYHNGHIWSKLSADRQR
jgi:hypothetical protein